MCVCLPSHFSRVRLFATPWTIARQAPLSTGFSRQEYWSGLPCPPPGDIPDPGIKPTFLKSPALAVMFFTTRTTWEALKTRKCPSFQKGVKCLALKRKQWFKTMLHFYIYCIIMLSA